MGAASFSVTGLSGVALVKKGDNIARIIVEAAMKNGIGLQEKDIVIVAQKIVSKAEGRLKRLSEVRASTEAAAIAKTVEKDPRLVQLILEESESVLKVSKEAIVVRDKRGLVCINAGVDRSNVGSSGGEDEYTLLPVDPDVSARRIMEEVFKLTGKHVGVVVCDTFSRPFRRGQANFAIGVAGIKPFYDYRGCRDLFGYVLKVKNSAVADELAAAAELVMGQGDEGVPIVIVRGLKRVVFDAGSSARELQISSDEDLFNATF